MPPTFGVADAAAFAGAEPVSCEPAGVDAADVKDVTAGVTAGGVDVEAVWTVPPHAASKAAPAVPAIAQRNERRVRAVLLQ